MAKAQIIEINHTRGEYDLPATVAIIDHPTHGRLLLSMGFGGLNTIEGGAYRWQHGVAIALQPGDTLASLSAGVLNECANLYDAVLSGHDDTRPYMDWTGNMIAACAEATGL